MFDSAMHGWLVEEASELGMRLRKSIRLGPGVRLNVSKTGLGISAGVKGVRYSVHSSGRKTKTVGVPGTGIYYQTQKGSGGGRTRSAHAAPAATPVVATPGLLAPKHEKRFAAAVHAYSSGDSARALGLFVESATLDTADRALSDDFFAGVLLAQSGSPALGVPYLEKVVLSTNGLPDSLMERYVGSALLAIPITPALSVSVEMGSLAAALVLVECYQDLGRVDEAVGLIQQLVEASPHKALVASLCELLSTQGAWHEVVEVAAGTINADNIDVQILIYLGTALSNVGMDDAALVSYKEALKSRKRSPELLWWARYNRAHVHLRGGRRARARSDFAAIYAENPRYGDVATQLSQLSAAH